MAALSLAACGSKVGEDAAASAHALLQAAGRGDRVAMEGAIDRQALRADLTRQSAEVAQTRGLDIPGGPSEAVLDRMISPHLVVEAARGAGLGSPLPPAPDLARRMIRLTDRRVCLADAVIKDRCLLTFGREGKTWRLVGMEAAAVKTGFPGAAGLQPDGPPRGLGADLPGPPPGAAEVD